MGRAGLASARYGVVSIAAAGRALRLDAAGLEAVAALRDAGIDVLLVKGPVTARWLYAGEARTYVDIDLLVAPASFTFARDVLGARGFHGVTSDHVGGEQELVRDADGATIDLHRSLKEIRIAPDDAWTVLWSRREPFVLHGRTVDVLDEPARLFHLCSHALTSGATKSKPRDDLARGVTLAGARWAGAVEVARALGAVPAMATALQLYGDEAGAALARDLGIARSVPPLERLRSVDSSGVIAMARKLARGGSDERRALLRGWLAPEPARLERRLQRHDVPAWLRRRRPTRGTLLLLLPVLVVRAVVSVGRGVLRRATR